MVYVQISLWFPPNFYSFLIFRLNVSAIGVNIIELRIQMKKAKPNRNQKLLLNVSVPLRLRGYKQKEAAELNFNIGLLVADSVITMNCTNAHNDYIDKPAIFFYCPKTEYSIFYINRFISANK